MKKIDEEIWKDIDGFEGLYEVSNHGRVRSTDYYIEVNGGGYWHKGKVLKQQLSSCREMTVCLGCAQLRKKRKPYLVNRLVAIAFIPNPYGLPEAIHIDCNNINNRADNLQWGTRTECINKEITKMRRSVSLSEYKKRVDLHEKFIERRPIAWKRSQETRMRGVVKYDLNGNFIQEYKRVVDAERDNGLSKGHIHTCIKRGNKIKGFIYKFSE